MNDIYINEYGVEINVIEILEQINIKAIARKHKANIDFEDAQQIVILAIIEAMPTVKNIGDRIAYLAWKGKCALISETRKTIRIYQHECEHDISEFAEVIADKKVMDIEETDFLRSILDDFKGSGRKEDILNLMISGYDRDNCKNYIKDIAEKLGISTTAVNLRLREIKKKISDREDVIQLRKEMQR